MRKFLAFLVLLMVATFWAGCGSNSNSNTATTSNSTGTTTYNKSDAATSAPSVGGQNTTGAAPKPTPTAPGIKPPTEK